MANLQIAIQVAKSRLNLKNQVSLLLMISNVIQLHIKQVRFAWWGAEELGLLGSRYYVGTLEEGEKDNISLYLNFDMLVRILNLISILITSFWIGITKFPERCT